MDSVSTPPQQRDLLVPNSPVPKMIKDRTLKTLPEGLRFCVWMDRDGDGTAMRMKKGIFAAKEFKAGMWFGPYEGSVILPSMATTKSEDMWEIHCSGKLCHYLDSSNEDVANWMRYVSLSKEPSPLANLLAYQYQGSIYYHSYTAIAAGQELRVCLKHFKLEDGPTGLKDKPLSCGICQHMHLGQPLSAVRYTHKDVPATKPASRTKVTVSPDTAATKRRALNSKIDKLRQKLNVDSVEVSITENARLFDFSTRKNSSVSSNLHDSEHTTDSISSRAASDRCRKQESSSRLALDLRASQPSRESPSEVGQAGGAVAKGLKAAAPHHSQGFSGGQRLSSLVSLLSKPSRLSFPAEGARMLLATSRFDMQQGKLTETIKNEPGTSSAEVVSVVPKSEELLCSKPYSGTLLLASVHVKERSKFKEKRTQKLLGSRRFYCVYCQWRYKDPYHFIRHKRSHMKHYQRVKGGRKASGADGNAPDTTGKGARMFSCSICDRSFKEAHTMKTHERSHANHTCHYCGRVFGSSTARIVHERTHTGERPYQCDLCPKAFRTSYMRTRHKQQCHTTERPYKCEYCNKMFKVKNAMTTHMKTHTHEKNLPCPVCGKNFGLPRDLLRHVKTHTDERPFQCEYCKKTYKQKSTLTTHVQKHFVGDFPCQYCPLKFRTTQAHGRHESVHTGVQPVFKRVEKPFPCRYCDRVFPRNVKRKVHERVHTGELPFQCELCQKAYSSKKGLESHMRTHSDERPYPCLICGKSFKERNTLKCHVRIHTGVRPFKCEQCDKTFRVSDALKKHRRSHSDERAYKCQQCEKAFKQLSALRKHERWHLGLRPHICDICGRDFVDRYRLRIHQSIHLEVRPHKCSMCDKSFTEACRLKRHLRDHENRREFQCDICSKKFNFKDHLETHVKTHSEERPFQCQSCFKCFKNSSALHRHQRVHSDQSFSCPVCNKCLKTMKSLKRHALQHLEKEIMPLDVSSSLADLCGIIPPDTELSAGNESSHSSDPHQQGDLQMMSYGNHFDQDTGSSQSNPPGLPMYPKSLGMYPEDSQHATDSDQSTIVDEEESTPKGIVFPESSKDMLLITPLNPVKTERMSEDE